MLCDNLYQLNDVFSRYDFHPSSSDLINMVCGNCEKTEVCPAGGLIDNVDESNPLSVETHESASAN